MTSTDLFAQAFELHQAGRTTRAESHYRKILKEDPRHDKSLYLLGLIALEANRLEEALEMLKRAVELAPHMPAYHTNLGVTLHRLKRHREAVDVLMTALSLKPDIAEANFNLGLALVELGDHHLAYFAFERAADFKPDSFDIQFNFAQLLKARAELTRSIGHYHCALSLKPKSVNCLVELGGALRALGRTTTAIFTLRQAVAQAPQSALAHCDLGVTLAKDGQLDEAIDLLQKATQLGPALAAAHANLGVALGDAGRILEAIASYRRALELKPVMHAVHSNILYMMPFAPQYNETTVYDETQAWSRTYAEPLNVAARAHENDRSVGRRLRVGYVSPHFFSHCQSFFTLPLLTHHSRDQIEIFCYSSVELPDETTRQLQSRADTWRDVLRLNNAELAELVRRDGIDILLDLTMHMENGRLPMFAHKPAPVQICWLAYPGTTGVSAVDYRITDRFLDPPDSFPRPYYSERSIILPNTFWCFDPLEADIEPGPLPALSKGHVTFGSLNNYRKIYDNVIELWAQVLRAVEGSRMLILAPEGQPREHLCAVFEQHGISAGRISFVHRLPRREYLQTYRQIDICLDTFPYSGHTTSLDSFWMGVPVISLLGSTLVGRAGVTIACNLHMEELIARTSDEYEQIARTLAADMPRLQETRLALRSRILSSPLMAHARFARNMEDAYRTAWRMWCEGGTSDRSPLIIADR